MGENKYTVEAADKKNGNKKQKKAKPYAPFPGVVLFYRSEDQAKQKYGKDETGYDYTFGFDTYIPILMGAEFPLLQSYNENQEIKTFYNATKKKEIVPIHIYPRKEELPDLKKLREHKKDESITLDPYRTSYKASKLHFPSEKTLVELCVVVEIPDDKDVNSSYKDYKKSMDEENQTIKFAIVLRNNHGCPYILKDEKKYVRAECEEIGLKLETESIEHKFKDKQKDVKYHKLKIKKEKETPFTANDISVIAYYESANSNEEENGKEMILGQLDIEQTSIAKYRENIQNDVNNIKDSHDYLLNGKVNLQPENNKIVVDINFVRIASSENDLTPNYFQETSNIIKRMNEIYRQIGIEFRRKGKSSSVKGYEHILIPDDEMKDPNTGEKYEIGTYTFREEKEEEKKTRTVTTHFPTGGSKTETEEYSVPYTYSDEHWKVNFGGKNTISFYKNVKYDTDIVELFRRKYCKHLFERKELYDDEIYKELRREYFASKKEEKDALALFSGEKKVEDIEKGDSLPKIEEINKHFAKYFENRLITVFIFDKIDIGKPKMMPVKLFENTFDFFRGGESGFATIKGNMVVLYAGAMTDMDYILAHELGHCLGLNHTFEGGRNISFEPEMAYNFTPKESYHGVSYNNIMDYSDVNPKFKGDTFAMFQQKEILDHLSSEYISSIFRGFNEIINYSQFVNAKNIDERQVYLSKLETLYKNIFGK